MLSQNLFEMSVEEYVMKYSGEQVTSDLEESTVEDVPFTSTTELLNNIDFFRPERTSSPINTKLSNDQMGFLISYIDMESGREDEINIRNSADLADVSPFSFIIEDNEVDL